MTTEFDQLAAAVLEAADREVECQTWDGYVTHRLSSNGTLVVLVDGYVQGTSIPGDGDGRWCLICDIHGGLLTDTNRRRLLGWIRIPEEWCEECRENLT